MSIVTVNSNAKINLFLDIKGKRDDGYHNIETVMQELKLHDVIHIEKSEVDELVCNNYSIPCDKRNTCIKALNLIREEFEINESIKIIIDKNIPPEAGMAGGSSNAASVIKGLNELWNLNMSIDKMCQIGLKIGADVPFCIVGGTCLCEDIGDKITVLTPFKWEHIIIVKPDISISTPEAYRCVKSDYYNSYVDNKIVEFIQKKDYTNVCKNIANTLEDVIIKSHSIISEVKEDLIGYGAISAIMTGSGSAVYGFFIDEQVANYAFDKLKNKYGKVFFTETK